MRIIGGIHKRRRFDVPKTFNARPTTDFAKENLFNVLPQFVEWEGCRALDLFAGTGSITIELLSRGCAHVTSVEMRREHALFIANVVEKLDEQHHFTLVRSDVGKYLPNCIAVVPMSFDFIFADPPYKLPWLEKLPQMVLGNDREGEDGLLAPGGVFVLEHPDSYNFSGHPWFAEHREYGAVNFSFFVHP